VADDASGGRNYFLLLPSMTMVDDDSFFSPGAVQGWTCAASSMHGSKGNILFSAQEVDQKKSFFTVSKHLFQVNSHHACYEQEMLGRSAWASPIV
jgi:hypothetical protein